MKWFIGIVLIALFAAVVVGRWPASAGLAKLPAPLSCAVGGGTVWNGACEDLRVGGQSLGALRWKLKFLPLLTGKVDAQIAMQSASADLKSQVRQGGKGAIELVDLDGWLSLPGPLTALKQFGVLTPDGLAGRLTIRRVTARLSASGRVEYLRGEMLADDLRQNVEPRQLGAWTLIFDGEVNSNGEPVGQLRDRGGPFDAQATLRLTDAPGYLLEGTLAPREGVAPQVLDSLRFLGRPDAAGRRPIAIEGSF